MIQDPTVLLAVDFMSTFNPIVQYTHMSCIGILEIRGLYELYKVCNLFCILIDIKVQIWKKAFVLFLQLCFTFHSKPVSTFNVCIDC